MYCNECIACSVDSCRHHHDSRDYCTLQSIRVGTHEANPTEVKCTDCESFRLK